MRKDTAVRPPLTGAGTGADQVGEVAQAAPAGPPPRTRLAILRTRTALPDGTHTAIGGDIWLEHAPFPHVRVGQTRFPLSEVISWSLPSDLNRKA